MDEQIQEQTAPVPCSESELLDAADPDSAVTCTIVGEHTQHVATVNGATLRWPDVEQSEAS